MTRMQFCCSNTSNLCDHCGIAMCLHSVGNYYCPAVVRRISAFHPTEVRDVKIEGPEPVFNVAWNERVRLRKERSVLEAKLAELDAFIAMHERLSIVREPA